MIDCQRARSSIAEDPVDRAAVLRDAVTAAFPRAVSATVAAEPVPAELERARALTEGCDAILLVTRDAEQVEHHARLGRELVMGPRPLVHAAVRAPFDAHLFPGAAATLLTYGDPPVSLRALVDVLAGRAQAHGIPPVTLPGPPVA